MSGTDDNKDRAAGGNGAGSAAADPYRLRPYFVRLRMLHSLLLVGLVFLTVLKEREVFYTNAGGWPVWIRKTVMYGYWPIFVLFLGWTFYLTATGLIETVLKDDRPHMILHFTWMFFNLCVFTWMIAYVILE